MAGPEVVGFSIDVDLKALRAQLASIPGITKKEATAMVKELRDRYKDAEKATKDLAGTTETSMKKVETSTGAARAGAANLGNQFADIAIQLESGTPIGRIMLQQGFQVVDALGMMGTAAVKGIAVIGALGIAVGAGAAAWRIYSADTREAEERAADMAFTAQSLRPLMDSLRTVTLDLSVATGEQSKLMGDLERATRSTYTEWIKNNQQTEAQIAALTKEEASLTSQVRDAARSVYELLDPTGLWVEAYDGLYGSSENLTDRVRLLREQQQAQIPILGSVVDKSQELLVVQNQSRLAAERETEAERRRAEALAERQRLADADLRDLQARAALDAKREELVAQLVSIEAEATTARLDDAGKVEAALEAQLATIRAITAEAVKLARPGEAPFIEARGLDAEVAAVAAANDQIRAIREREDRLRDAEAQKEIDRQKKIQDATVNAVTFGLSMVEQGFSDLADNRAATVARIEDQLTRSEEYLTDDQREQLEARLELQKSSSKRAFEIAKAFKIAQAMVATFTAANEALASGTPYPFNVINAGIVTGMGLANVATIAKQNPTFHRGGTVDEVPATVLRGEAVLSRQGRAVIGDETVNRANAGMGTGGGSSTTVYQVYDGRILDVVMADTIARGGRVDGYVRKQRTTPYGHRS